MNAKQYLTHLQACGRKYVYQGNKESDEAYMSDYEQEEMSGQLLIHYLKGGDIPEVLDDESLFLLANWLIKGSVENREAFLDYISEKTISFYKEEIQKLLSGEVSL